MEEKRKKLLYIMGIDWDWIFQRPQIMEQYLEQDYDVTVIFPRSIHRFLKQCRGTYPKNYKILWTLPWQEKSKIINFLSCILTKRIFSNIDQYAGIIIGYPLYYRYIPKTYSGSIIYDCMDNYEALYPAIPSRKRLVALEKSLSNASAAIVVTGSLLQKKIETIVSDHSKHIELIRNGVSLQQTCYYSRTETKGKYKIGYIGTIAEWFDYNVLLLSLKQFDDVEYHLIGPVIKHCPEENVGIIMEGVINHEMLTEITKDYACLVMPFVVNDVVKWVDPVKLYEYIAMGKCIISVKYDEIVRFENYVYFYSSTEEYLELIQCLKNKAFPPKYTPELQRTFLESNSWQKRFINFSEIVEKTLQDK